MKKLKEIYLQIEDWVTDHIVQTLIGIGFIVGFILGAIIF